MPLASHLDGFHRSVVRYTSSCVIHDFSKGGAEGDFDGVPMNHCARQSDHLRPFARACPYCGKPFDPSLKDRTHICQSLCTVNKCGLSRNRPAATIPQAGNSLPAFQQAHKGRFFA